MPLALVRFKRSSLTHTELNRLTERLTIYAALALHCDGPADFETKPSDIEVWVNEASLYDRNIPDLAIVIFAHQHPARSVNLEDRREQLGRSIREHLELNAARVQEAYVQIHLTEASYGPWRSNDLAELGPRTIRDMGGPA